MTLCTSLHKAETEFQDATSGTEAMKKGNCNPDVLFIRIEKLMMRFGGGGWPSTQVLYRPDLGVSGAASLPAGQHLPHLPCHWDMHGWNRLCEEHSLPEISKA